ncbi:hypothetical protein NCS57_01279400 [Fusarium keratoplasticum]|uniref:Uncharacterized protein n=1 Tax=Fusarium keratoplasticum TaxID=1328300 RepID=A0ACC0QK41_9HYPO|nr:hypothetical protein NCS57_01279400 [Fusarium keratoplasticum]KAI8655308.1 hypothetical protein NCS57_01279400 [Fusarium keratoplasticum]KAI8656140.1 hypothetical protein NCS55_01268700 [Fusarium keratoplasticum]
MSGRGEHRFQAGKEKEDTRDGVRGSREGGRNSSARGGSSSSRSEVQARPGGDTILTPNSLEIRSLKDDLGQTVAAWLYNKRGGPARDVIAAADDILPGAISFQGNFERSSLLGSAWK